MNFLGTLIGKLIRLGLSFRPNGGHALPGLVIDKIFSGYVPSMLKQVPDGVVMVTGTNGKTTTTKIITHLLTANGKRVLTNSTGSNLVRGIASSLAQNASLTGRLPYDIAVYEVDEAAARVLVQKIRPRWVLALNVSRDQLDRFGEVDTIAAYIADAMKVASEGVVTNADDPHLVGAAKESGTKVEYFGVSSKLAKFFPTDYELAAVDKVARDNKPQKLDVELTGFEDRSASYKIDGKIYETKLMLTGQHNFLNAAASLSVARQILPEAKDADLVNELSNVTLAFGRGEKYRLPNGEIIELVLVKNPASFTQALASYGGENANYMVTINDNIADGRDVSWLWDVNFSPLSGRNVSLTSGTRAADMALRFHYDDIKTERIEPELEKALNILSELRGRKVILATYTAMLRLYAILNKKAEKVV